MPEIFDKIKQKNSSNQNTIDIYINALEDKKKI